MGCQMEEIKGNSMIISQPSVPMPAVHTYIRTSQQDREGIVEHQIH